MDEKETPHVDGFEDPARVARARKGDPAAFDDLVENQKERVYRIALRMLGHSHDALDVVQEVFVRVHRGLAGLEDPARFVPWLTRITVRCALDHRRRRGQAMTVPLPDLPTNRPRPEDQATDLEIGAAIRSAIDQLPEDQRTAILLRDVEGLAYREIAEICRVPRGTVMSRIHYARRKLREKLRPHLADR